MAAVALLDHASPNIMGEYPSAADPFDISDYMLFDDDGGSERLPVMMSASTEAAAAAGNFSSTATATATATTGGGGVSSSSNNNRSGEVAVGSGGGGGLRIAFRTQSEQEIMDDGFKWRKYGKKAVKNSPNPRNYYRCSTEGCTVKKRVERDREDPSYVITTYEGIHNHTSPGVVYYTTQDSTSGRFLVAGCGHIPPTSSSQC